MRAYALARTLARAGAGAVGHRAWSPRRRTSDGLGPIRRPYRPGPPSTLRDRRCGPLGALCGRWCVGGGDRAYRTAVSGAPAPKSVPAGKIRPIRQFPRAIDNGDGLVAPPPLAGLPAHPTHPARYRGWRRAVPASPAMAHARVVGPGSRDHPRRAPGLGAAQGPRAAGACPRGLRRG